MTEDLDDEEEEDVDIEEDEGDGGDFNDSEDDDEAQTNRNIKMQVTNGTEVSQNNDPVSTKTYSQGIVNLGIDNLPVLQ